MTNLPDPQTIESCAGEVLLGDSDTVARLRLQIARVAPHFRVALVSGEPGTGKRAVALHLHGASPVAAQPFTAIPTDQFAQHAPQTTLSGTIYLPRLEALPAALQTGLLRSLRSLHRETRVVFGTRSEPRGMVAAGRLTHQLYERIGSLQIRLTPLHERPEDLPAIAHAMLRRLGSTASFAPSSLDLLERHTWPESLRDLHALCAHLATIDGPIEADRLPPFQTAAPAPPTARLEDVLQRHVMDVLETCAGNKLRAAELLGISRSTLYRMLGNQPAL